MCVYTYTHTMVSLETKFSSGNLNPANSLSVTFLSPEAKPYIAFFLHSFRNPEQEQRLNCCFETTMLSGKQCAQERRKQQYKLPQAAPPTRKRRDRSTLPLELMDLSNTLFHAFCF